MANVQCQNFSRDFLISILIPFYLNVLPLIRKISPSKFFDSIYLEHDIKFMRIERSRIRVPCVTKILRIYPREWDKYYQATISYRRKRKSPLFTWWRLFLTLSLGLETLHWSSRPMLIDVSCRNAVTLLSLPTVDLILH